LGKLCAKRVWKGILAKTKRIKKRYSKRPFPLGTVFFFAWKRLKGGKGRLKGERREG
jgi:hypothetical protein